MLLVTNPGTNVPMTFVEEHAITMLPQQIVVDEVFHDTRTGMSLDTIDEWVAGAKVHPYVLGTSAAEFAGHLTRLSAEDSELLVIMTSRNLIQSYDACKSACKTLANQRKWRHLKIRVIDSGVTDIGTGLVTMYAAEARAAGFGLDEVANLTEEFVAATQTVFVVQELDYVVKGGRASFVKAWAAKFFGVRPILAFVDGFIEPVGKYKTKLDPTDVLRDWLLESQGADTGRRVWMAVSHGHARDQAETLAAKLEAAFEVKRRMVLPLAPSIYLHGGRGCVAAAITNLDALSWVPQGRLGWTSAR